MSESKFPSTRRRAALPRAIALAFPCLAGLASAQNTLEPVVITGSVSAQSAAQAPYAITVVDQDALRSAGPQINLSESMSRVPGLVVANRNNYAQDLQISSRGFGARSGFGVRGIRLYTDGIPASMPDGQGQVSHFDLAGAQRIEVLRGPFSVLYGNSSGGVIALVSADPKETVIDGTADFGSYGLRQQRVGVAGVLGNGFTLRGTVSRLEVDGFRPHSEAKRTAANVRLGWAGEADRVIVLLNSLDQPADDPLGLDRQRFDTEPSQTTPEATRFDTRKTTRQVQVGANWRHAFDLGGLSSSQFTVYQGKRSVAQWLAIPTAVQTSSPRHGGGVIDFDRDYKGLDARLNFGWETLDVVVGGAYESSTDARFGYENFTGAGAAQVLGVTGRLRRDETNEARTTDGYAQFEWRFSPAWVASGGVRSGHADLSSTDNYLSNGNDSGNLRFGYTNPVLGLRWTAAPGLNLHASLARGFESPTLGDLAYRPDGIGGFNTALRPQKSRQFEVGAKWRTGATQFESALFRVDTTDEIGVATNSGGRSSFQNVGRTRRTGAELSARWQATDALHALTSVTLLDAKYRDNFLTCPSTCAAATVPVPAGNRIAGTNRGNAYAELGWKPRADQEYGLEVRAASGISVNDTNTDATPRYALVNLRVSKRYTLNGNLSLELLARVDNLFDKVYAGSVIVNDANGRYFEPGAPRTLLLSVKVSGKP